MNLNNAFFEKAFGTKEQLEQSTLPEFCFSGRSNVGKSSLINKITGRKSLARVSGEPGKTVTINFYNAKTLRLVDLPGYGYAKVPFAEKNRWSELMEGYFNSGRNIKTVFQLIDMRHKPTEFDLSMLEFLSYYKIPFVIVLTKSDKLNVTETKNRMESISSELGEFAENAQIIPFSAKNGKGAEEIKAIIESLQNEA